MGRQGAHPARRLIRMSPGVRSVSTINAACRKESPDRYSWKVVAVLTFALGRFVPVNKPSVPLIACWSSFSCSPPFKASRSEASKPENLAASVRL